MSAKILACDLGGTNTRLALAPFDRERVAHSREQRYKSGDFDGLASIVQRFLEEMGQDPEDIVAATFALAGPVRPAPGGGQQAQVTNLPWQLASNDLEQQLNLSRVTLINDFEAIGYGLEALRPEQLLTLQTGSPADGAPRALLGAGTGLGQALLFRHGDSYRVYPTEGGHVNFGPRSPLEVALWEQVHQRLGRVSYENLLSGSGLERIYEFVRSRRQDEEPQAMRQALRHEDPAAVVSRFGMGGESPSAAQALDMFLAIYGAQAGNLALNSLALGGIYVAGGIAAHLIDRFADSAFLEAFHDKGKMSRLMESFPVHVIRDPDIGLDGATHHAWHTARGSWSG